MSATDEHNLLEIDNLSVSLRGNRILDEITLRVRKGHIHALTGPNGAGKTTLMRSVMGGMPIKEPSVSFSGKAVESAMYRNSWSLITLCRSRSLIFFF